jgi:hypothetical protein
MAWFAMPIFASSVITSSEKANPVTNSEIWPWLPSPSVPKPCRGRTCWYEERAAKVHTVEDDTWMAGVGLFGAHIILDGLEALFGIT